MIPSLPADKANHFAYGALVSVLFYTLGLAAHRDPMLAASLALAAVAAIGVAKELVDALINRRATGDFRRGPHGVELMDLIATVAGGTPLWLAAHLPRIL